MRTWALRTTLDLTEDEEAGMVDHSYGQAYADWQAELRAAARAPERRPVAPTSHRGRLESIRFAVRDRLGIGRRGVGARHAVR